MANLPKETFLIDTDFFQSAIAASGRSQNEVADFLGIDKGAMSLLLNGKREMKIREAVTLSKLLGLTLDQVIVRSGALSPKSKPTKLKRKG
jgi:transcriptional regulator with XRE-family HTH domain